MLNESTHSLTRCKKNIQVLKETGMIMRQKAWFANQEPYQYVLELRERLDETMKLAQAELEKNQIRNKKLCNRKAKWPTKCLFGSKSV